MIPTLLFIIIILLICVCLFLSQLLWQKETYHLENKKINTDNRNENMTKMVHSQFYANLFFSAIFGFFIFLILLGLDSYDIISLF